MKKIIGLFFLLFSINGYCKWTPTGEGEGFLGFIDESTIKRTGNIVRAWELMSFKEPQKSSTGAYQSMVVLTDYDCKNERTRVLSLVTYAGSMGKGSVTSTLKPTDEWDYVTPNSKTSYMFGVLCKLK